MNIENNVLDVLSNAVVTGNALKLVGQLDRKLYVATNKVLELAGGKWNRKAQTHLFDGDASDIMEQIILTGKITNKQQELGYFPTPLSVVTRLLELADVQPHHRVLEPSAGKGNILQAIGDQPGKVAVEIDPALVAVLNGLGLANTTVRQGDFLEQNGNLGLFDRVVMNPPFAKQADIRHVTHALNFLKPGGRLVSVTSASVGFRTNAMTETFRSMLKERGGEIESLPENAFAESGTGVNTVIVSIPS